MPQQRTKANGSGLGKALINRKSKEAHAPRESQLYTLDDTNPLQSVTHERDLDEFLANAALADMDFTTERSKLRIIAGPGAASSGSNPYLLNEVEKKEVEKKKRDLASDLRVPRRPAWTRKTTRLELEKQERESFLEWRRDLARLSESSNLLLTPFERNIQLWRQLWRVLERSHVIVQIVDARNPLGFRCLDLEEYVQEVGDEDSGEEVTVPGKGKRRSLLLVNKADLLTIQQREAWADYFEANGVDYAFFSAMDAAAAQEQIDKRLRREQGLEEEDDEGDDEEDVEAANGEEETGEVSGEEVEPQEDDDQEEEEEEEDDEEEEGQDAEAAHLNKVIDATTLEDYEEGWSTEGEDEEEEDEGEAAKKLAEGKKVSMKEVVHDIDAKNGQTGEEENIRTRVLTVAELEELFQNAAPDLADFATPRDPNPSKLIVGLVGYPNVGKSSTINALLGAKKVSVSSTPGKTKHFQTLVLSDEITLCDCPGLVFPQFANTQADMVVDGVLPIDQMREYSAPVDLLCQRIPREILEGVYGIRIDVKDEEEGGTGKVGWEDLLSTYAIARGMTRASFGMPDTSRAARYVLKDYVNAKLLYGHPPPGMTSDDYMSSSREKTLQELEEAFENGRKRAPVTHVSKNADTFVRPAPAAEGDQLVEGSSASAARQRQFTTNSIKANAASAPMRSGKQKAEALDGVFFNDVGPAPRPVLTGRQQRKEDIQEGLGFSRPTQYPHQRMLGPDGMPLIDAGKPGKGMGGSDSKRHFKGREGKKRSGRGYD